MTSYQEGIGRRAFVMNSLVTTTAVTLGSLFGPKLPKRVRNALEPGQVSASPTSPPRQMRVLLQAAGLSDNSLRYLKQIGVDDVLVYTFDIPGYKNSLRLDIGSLKEVKRRIESYGLRLSALVLDQRVLANFLMSKSEGYRDLDNLCWTIERMGEVSIPCLLYSLLVSRAILNTTGRPLPGYFDNPAGRGGTILKSFDEERAKQVIEEPAGRVSKEQMWERITQFQRRCVPVADSARVSLACHPDDPPILHHWGVSQVLNSMEGLKKFIQIVPSAYNGLLLCQGTIQEAKIDVLEFIRYFGSKGKIAHVEFRGVRGTIPRYDEVFMDEGDLDLWAVVKALKEVRYRGLIEVAHVPQLTDDPNHSIVNAWSVGYIKGLLAAANDPQYHAATP